MLGQAVSQKHNVFIDDGDSQLHLAQPEDNHDGDFEKRHDPNPPQMTGEEANDIFPAASRLSRFPSISG